MSVHLTKSQHCFGSSKHSSHQTNSIQLNQATDDNFQAQRQCQLGQKMVQEMQAKGQSMSKSLSIFQEQSTDPYLKYNRSKSMEQKVMNLNDKLIFEAIYKKDYKKSISLLSQLESYITKGDSGQGYSTSARTRNDKLLYHFELSVCYFNYAVVYQRLQNTQETAFYFSESLKNLEQLQGFITKNRQEGVSYSIELAKLQLQYCSILSQNSKHQEAITFAEKSLQKLIQCFRVLEAILFEHQIESYLPDTSSNSKITVQGGSSNQSASNTRVQFIDFKKHMLNEAQKMIKEIISSIHQTHDLIVKFRPRYDELMQKMFFWKENSENNEKHFRKELALQRQYQWTIERDGTIRKQKAKKAEIRSILGVQKSLFAMPACSMSHSDHFHQSAQQASNNSSFLVQRITNLQPKSLKYTFSSSTLPSFSLFSTPRLTEMVFYVSMLYFTIATEMRFSQTDLANLNKLKIDKKYQKLYHDERVLKYKMIHMKGIEIAGKFLPAQNSDLFSHILKRFNSNYKSVLEEIHEQSSRQQSLMTQADRTKHFAQQSCSNENIGNMESQDYGQLYFKVQNQSQKNTKKSSKLSLKARMVSQTQPQHLSEAKLSMTMPQDQNHSRNDQKHNSGETEILSMKRKHRSKHQVLTNVTNQKGHIAKGEKTDSKLRISSKSIFKQNTLPLKISKKYQNQQNQINYNLGSQNRDPQYDLLKSCQRNSKYKGLQNYCQYSDTISDPVQNSNQFHAFSQTKRLKNQRSISRQSKCKKRQTSKDRQRTLSSSVTGKKSQKLVNSVSVKATLVYTSSTCQSGKKKSNKESNKGVSKCQEGSKQKSLRSKSKVGRL